MKTISIIILAIGLCSALPQGSRAQSVAGCIQQLALDYEKLASLKSVLSQMYNGYAVLSKGYDAVRDVSQGNFSLHEAFLDGLFLVSPTVRKYPRVADIINDQASLVAEYRDAAGRNRQSGMFNPGELSYLMTVYNNLISASLKNLDDLALVMSEGQLRMSDAERLSVIDRIYVEGRSQLSYLRKFNSDTEKVARQRGRSVAEQQSLKNLYGIH